MKLKIREPETPITVELKQIQTKTVYFINLKKSSRYFILPVVLNGKPLADGFDGIPFAPIQGSGYVFNLTDTASIKFKSKSQAFIRPEDIALESQ